MEPHNNEQKQCLFLIDKLQHLIDSFVLPETGECEYNSAIIHKNLFDSSATSEANAENSGRKHFYKDGKFRPKDLRGSKKSAPRLRTKTRSKVKNFKRDTRTNEQKAARGLQVFNE